MRPRNLFKLLLIFTLLLGVDFLAALFSSSVLGQEDIDDIVCVYNCNPPPRPPQTYYIYRSSAELAARDRAHAAWENKDWQTAITEDTEALRLCRQQGKLDCSHLLKNIAYENVYLWRAVGNTFWEEGDWEGVIRAYLTALDFCVGDMDCVQLRNALARARGNLGNAQERTRRAGIRERMDAAAARASRNFSDGSWDRAISAYQEALRFCQQISQNCSYYQEMIYVSRWNKASDRAGVYFNNGNYDGAIPLYREALNNCRLAGRNCTNIENLLAYTIKNSKRDIADSFIENQDWEPADAVIRVALGDCRAAGINCQNLENYVPRARRDFEASRALAYEQNDNWEAAVRRYDAALRNCTPGMDCRNLENRREHADYMFNSQDYRAGMKALANEDYDAALEYLWKAIEKDENSLNVNNYGFALSQMGRTDEAIIAYKRAYELDPSNIKAARNLVIYLPEEDLDSAILLLENSLLMNSRESDPEFYDKALETLADFKEKRSTFGHDWHIWTNKTFDYISGFFDSGDASESKIPNVALDQLIQATANGKQAIKYGEDFERMTSASDRVGVVFDRGKNYRPSGNVFTGSFPGAPEIDGVVIDFPVIDVSSKSQEVRDNPRFKSLEQQAALLGQEFVKQKIRLDDLKKQAKELPPESPRLPEIEDAIEQTQGDLGDTTDAMEGVGDDIMFFDISFEEDPNRANNPPPEPDQ